MLPNEHDRADALEQALAALHTGAALEDAALRLDVADAVLLEAAAGLGAIAALTSVPSQGGPSATFVLGLEEQLRTDLRLGVAQREPIGWARFAGAVTAGLMVVVGAVLVARSEPGDFLYGAKTRLEAIALGGSARSQTAGAVSFEQGRRRLEQVARTVEADTGPMEGLDALLDEVLRLYAAGTAAASRSDDVYAQSRARIEVEAADAALMRLEDVAAPAERMALGETRAALKRVLVPLPPDPGNGMVTPVAAASPAPSPITVATAVAPGTTPTTKPPAEATPTAVGSVAPIASASPTASPSSTAVPATRVPRDPDPTSTPAQPIETVGPPGDVRPTPTRDAWPTNTPPGAVETAQPGFPPPASPTPPADRDPGAARR